jgi:hypothetical protein
LRSSSISGIDGADAASPPQGEVREQLRRARMIDGSESFERRFGEIRHATDDPRE